MAQPRWLLQSHLDIAMISRRCVQCQMYTNRGGSNAHIATEGSKSLESAGCESQSVRVEFYFYNANRDKGNTYSPTSDHIFVFKEVAKRHSPLFPRAESGRITSCISIFIMRQLPLAPPTRHLYYATTASSARCANLHNLRKLDILDMLPDIWN